MIYRVYIGGYTGPQNKGITVCDLDSRTGRLSNPRLAAETPNPSFLAIHPEGKFLYAANELDGDGAGWDRLTGFAIDPATGFLAEINQHPSGGLGPCHVSLDPSGKVLLAANYGSGSICSVSVDDQGRMGPAGTVIQHHGSGPDHERQEGPHAHGIYTDASGAWALAVDLGLDRVLVYALDAAGGTMAAEPACVGVAPAGAGPRHLAWSNDGRRVYVVNEMAASVSVFAWDAAAPALTAVQTVSCYPREYRGARSAAEVVLHPGGRFVFVSNRGDNSITTMAVGSDGTLNVHASSPCGGKSPRHIFLTPGAEWMLVSNQDSGNVAVMKVNAQTGAIEPTGSQVQVSKATCAIVA
ncbi:MAG: lactonase family protein [Planctomycetaceae bacterium]|nr:lactonase family protein [Planctomycetaceae bacterium]